MNLEKELLETAVRNLSRSKSVQRVISMESESALPQGENYLSTIYRITLKVVLGNGRTAKRSLILKVVPPEKVKTDLVKSMGVFKSETMMYTIVLREMEALMDEFGDTNDVLWCRLLHYEPYTSLLLEDLKAEGFKMTRRQDCLDLDHSLLVLRSLGRFHGMAKILEQRGIISRSDYKPYPLITDENLVKYFMYYALQTLSKAMKDNWGPEWYDVAQTLNIPCDVLTEKFFKLSEVDETRFNCLNHGDCWSNNMMFKYDWRDRPYTMRFLDLQMSHYNSPVFDIMYFIYTSADAELRHKNIPLMLEAWHKSLMDTLDFYGYTGARPTVQGIMDEMKTSAFDFRIVGLMIHMLTRADASDAFDLEVAINSPNKVAGYNMEIYLEEKLKQRIGPDIREFAGKYI